MPPRRYSRYTFSDGYVEDDGSINLTDPVPFRYRDLDDNETHNVEEGDTLFNIAGRKYAPLPRPSGLWWVIAQFQPQPINDPTCTLVKGDVLVIPSLRTVEELLFNESRRTESVL